VKKKKGPMRLLRIALVTLALVASCSSGHSSVEATMDAASADTQQESPSAGDDLVCRCGESALIMAPSVATNVSADTCTVSQNGDGPYYSAKTTTGDPCIATFSFADGGVATVHLTFERPVGCCSGRFMLLFSGIVWQ
jgi:hypothetical protein